MPSISSRHPLVLPLVAALSLAACAHSQQPAEPSNSSDVAPTGRGGMATTAIRARYEGVLPCADCSGIQTELMLLADGSYVMRQTYQGKGDTAYEMRGRYNTNTGTPAAPNATVYRLTPENGDDRLFVSANGGQELRLLDQNKQEIASQNPHTLKLTGGSPVEP